VKDLLQDVGEGWWFNRPQTDQQRA